MDGCRREMKRGELAAYHGVESVYTNTVKGF